MRRGTGPAALLLGLALLGQASTAQAGFAGLSLREALESLRARGLRLIYSSELVRADMRVEQEPAGSTLREVLDALLAPHGLAAREGSSRTILVVPALRVQAPAGVVRGVVRAQDTGLPAAGAQVRLGGTTAAAWTDREGRFELLRVAAGRHTVEAVLPGYAVTRQEGVLVRGDRAVELEIMLAPQPRMLQEVIVTPSQYGFLSGQPEPRQVLDRQEVQRLPHLWDDAFRVVHRLPGAASEDTSSQFGVRGGSPDEVMLVLDGMQIHDPFHLRGLARNFSIIDSEIVGGVDLQSAGFPVEYGDRLSGVLELRSVLPERSRWALGASGVSARVLAAGGRDDGGASWLVSLRRGYAEWVLGWLESIDEEPNVAIRPVFYDLYATLRWPLGERAVLSAHLLAARDDLDLEDMDRREKQRGETRSWALWANLFTASLGDLTSHTVASVADDQQSVEGSSGASMVRSSRLSDRRSYRVWGVRQDWVWEPGRSHLLKWGGEVRHGSASYDLEAAFSSHDPVLTGLETPHVVLRSAHLRPRGWQLAAYGAERVRIVPGLTAEVGFRWDRQTWTPGDDQTSPRLNVVWELDEHSTVRASWGRYAQAQGVSELDVVDGDNAFHPAQWAEHRVLSFERAFRSGLTLRLEAYRKSMWEVRPHYENLLTVGELFPSGEADRVRVAPQRAEARGFELLLRGPRGRCWSWWLGAALAAAEDRIDGDWVPRSWDQRRALSVALDWRLRRGWDVNLAWMYRSGWPTTPFELRWQAEPDGTVEPLAWVGARNSSRLPGYSRVDLRVTRSLRLAGGRLRLFLEINNILDRTNVRKSMVAEYLEDPSGAVGVSTGDESWMPILPILGFAWEH